MKKLVISLIAMIFASTSVGAREKIAIAGSYCDTVIIIDKQTKAIEWSFAVPYSVANGGECNSISVNDKGQVLLSYKKGACLVDRQGNVIWNFERENNDQELHTAIQTNNGYMLGLCGRPARFIFLDQNGKKVSETSYETGINDIHSQFRQTRLSYNGNILIPMMGSGKLVEIDRKGNKVWEFAIGGGPYSVEEIGRTKLLVSGGDGVKEYSRKRGMLEKTIAKDSLQNVKFSFLTQSLRLANGNTILTNWQGHDNNTQTQIIEINPQGEIVWTFDDKKAMKYVSAICLFDQN